MFKKLLLGFAALGLTATAVPATAQPRVDFELSIGNRDYTRDGFRGYHRQPRPEWKHYNRSKYYPRCNRWEVAVRSPYYRNYWICIDKRDLRDRPYRYQ